MKISHLTFGQLLKLHSSLTLMRVDAAYSRALKRRWAFYYPTARFVRATAAAAFPECAARWKKVLDFLRSPELRHALRRAADEQQVPHTPAYMTIFRTVPWHSELLEPDAFQLARLTAEYVKAQGIPARLAKDPRRPAYQVLVETNEFGCAALVYQTGVPVETLQQYCRDGGLSFSKLFWWVPNGLNPKDRINPCVAPVNTPDANEIAAEFVWKEQYDRIKKFSDWLAVRENRSPRPLVAA